MRTTTNRKYGWTPDLPDHRDLLRREITRAKINNLPPSFDLTPKMPPVYDQGDLGSCTANAIAGACEFMRLLDGLPDWTPSRLFIYYQERLKEGTVKSDAGAAIRDGIKAVSSIGAPPESAWPYDISKFTVKPSAAAYKLASTHLAIKYLAVAQDISQIKATIAAGFPVVFGFSVYESFESASVAKSGVVYLPIGNERLLGGHAVVAVGYDDVKQRITVRNSWGASWGLRGYFTIPYAYLTNPDLASDFWTIQSAE